MTTRMVFEALIIKDNLKIVELKLGKMRHKVPDVISKALNRAVEATKTQAVKKTAGIYYLKQTDIRGKIKVYKSSKTSLRASAVSADRKLPIEAFKIRPNKPKPKKPPLIMVEIHRGKPKLFPGAFVIPNLKVYERLGKERYPIKRIWGPAIPQLIGGKKIRVDVQIESQKTYEKRLDHEIKRVLAAVGKK